MSRYNPEYCRAYREKNKAIIQAKARTYREKNKASRAAYGREYSKNNRDKHNEWKRKNRMENLERDRARDKEYFKKNKAQIKSNRRKRQAHIAATTAIWREKNREKVRLDKARYDKNNSERYMDLWVKAKYGPLWELAKTRILLLRKVRSKTKEKLRG